MTDRPALLNLRQVQDRLGISVSTMNRMIRRQEIPVIKLGRLIRIGPEALEQLIADRERPAEQ